MTEMLQEFCDWRGTPMGSDGQAGVIRGVKILGLQSRNGRTYLPEALAQAARLYEDTKVNVNHPKGSPLGPRDYQDRIGTIRNVAVRPGEGLFADFHFNPKHALAEQLLWDAEHAPENVGFSHNVEAPHRAPRRPSGRRGHHPRAKRGPGGRSGHDPRPVRVASGRGHPWRELAGQRAGNAAAKSSRERDARDPPQNAEIERLRAEVARLTLLEAAARKREKSANCWASSICPILTGPIPGPLPSPAGGSSKACWRRRTMPPCGPWSRSGRGWCGPWADVNRGNR